MTNVWYRIIIFIIMYSLLLGFIFHHIKKITKNPESSPTFNSDLTKKEFINENISIDNENKIFKTYLIFLSIVLTLIIIITSIDSLRSYTIVFLIVIFLIGGIISGLIVTNKIKQTLKSFINGVVAALPTILYLLLESS